MYNTKLTYRFVLTAADDEKLTSDLFDRMLEKNVLKNDLEF